MSIALPASRHRRLLIPIAMMTLLVTTSAVTAAPNAAVRAACAGDAKRLCGDVYNNPAARQACMQDHRAEWSDGCKAAVAERQSKQSSGPGAAGGNSAGRQNRRERCATDVADHYRSIPGSHNSVARQALRRCMQGGSI